MHRAGPTGARQSMIEPAGGDGSCVGATLVDVDFLLRDSHDFFQRGLALEDAFGTLLFQRHHAVRDRGVFDGRRVGFATDKPPDFVVEHHELENSDAPAIAGLGTGGAPGSSIEGHVGPRRDVQATEFFLAWRIGTLAVRTNPSQQALGWDRHDRRGDQKRFDPHIDQTGGGARRIVRMQGGKDQVSGEGGMNGDLRRFAVSNLADHDDIRVLSENRA